MKSLSIALLQIAPCGTLAGNLEKGIASCRRARELGADIALFPEMWSNGYHIYDRPVDQWKAEAIPAHSEFVGAFGALAKELGMAIAVSPSWSSTRAGRGILWFYLIDLGNEKSPMPRFTPATLTWSGT